MTRVTKAEATEWLGSLQQIGQGWYVNVALAVKAGAPQALGMTAREFAREIGQQLINPDDAIIELYHQKHSQERIAEVLGIGRERVEYVLAQAGVLSITPRRQAMLDAGSYNAYIGEQRDKNEAKNRSVQVDHDTEIRPAQSDSETEKLRKRVEKLTRERDAITDEADELQTKVADLKSNNRRLAAELRDVHVQARKDVEQQYTDKERARLTKEAEAWAAEKGETVMSGLAFLIVDQIVGTLGEAAEQVQYLLSQCPSLTPEHIAKIEEAHAAFVEEFNVARMSERS